jgi:hypothetical protein
VSSAASRVGTLVPRRAQSKTAKQETQELRRTGGQTAILCSVGELITWAGSRTASLCSGDGRTAWAHGRTSSLCSGSGLTANGGKPMGT